MRSAHSSHCIMWWGQHIVQKLHTPYWEPSHSPNTNPHPRNGYDVHLAYNDTMPDMTPWHHVSQEYGRDSGNSGHSLGSPKGSDRPTQTKIKERSVAKSDAFGIVTVSDYSRSDGVPPRNTSRWTTWWTDSPNTSWRINFTITHSWVTKIQDCTLWETTMRHSNIKRCPSINSNKYKNRVMSQSLIIKLREKRYRLQPS